MYLCNRCACKIECEYFEETVKPIIDATSSPFGYEDEFVAKIKEVLTEFECEYFE